MELEESHLIQYSFPKFSDQTNRHMEDAKVRSRGEEKDVRSYPRSAALSPHRTPSC